MNYRHIYHAGNICDVVKHAVLCRILASLLNKNKGFAVLDTHAGSGLYPLDDTRAQKTNEAQNGIRTFLNAPPLLGLEGYYSALQRANPSWSEEKPENFRLYPGSPFIVFHHLRAQDRLIACERHPEEARDLHTQAPLDARFQVHRRDGYEALNALLPPPEKRGLVLIDPPYEDADEFDTLTHHLVKAHKRWPSGLYMAWYPVKNRPAIWAFHEALAASGIPKILCAEFIYDENVRTDNLAGSGLVIINPPWGLDETLKTLFPALHAAMKTAYANDAIRWLAS
ncbi:MAG: 23S rRNA (adenine(2030)-N(6))-methyltransferase RlmJ [Alphaproteobacteria bacterium]|nr:23S rRNA (adenine(2030)-N(6))-methyltransferase RlmJ [Alphaproteobacteria bacterium]